jgi:hypothetical protein
MPRVAKTQLLYIVQSNYGYGHGWEDSTAETVYSEGRARLREYRENEPGVPHRLIQRREPIHASRSRTTRRRAARRR